MMDDAMEIELEVVSPSGKPPRLPVPIWSEKDHRDLRRAKYLLENPGLAAKLADLIGGPIEKGFKMLPDGWRDTVQLSSRKALMSAMKVASTTVRSRSTNRSSDFSHQVAVGATGCIGGLFGLPSMIWELPLSTSLMLRSMLDVARSEGHTPKNLMTRLSCLEVFALGGPATNDDAAESAYWSVRAGLSVALSDAAVFIARNGFTSEGAPAVVKLISTIAARFGVLVSEQAAAKAIPILGAVAGSTINVLFMRHFQDMARGHFIVKRLELKYGQNTVIQAYNSTNSR